MDNVLAPGQLVRDLIESADARLRDIDPEPFSPSAFRILKGKIKEYLIELVNESIKVSKRYSADTVSAAHVERASEYLVSSSSRRVFRHLGTLGGILLGAGLSTILAMTASKQYTATGTVLSLGLSVVGAFMIALHIAKE